MLGFFLPFNDSAKLNELVTLSNPNLEDILDLDCLIQEIKNANPKVISYFCRPSVLDSLVPYIIHIPEGLFYDPTMSCKESKANKFPYVISQIFCTQNETICESFLGLHEGTNFKNDNGNKANFWKQIQTGLFPGLSKETQEQRSRENVLEQSIETKAAIVPPIEKLLKFLDKPEPLNPTQAGYFAKILRNIFHSKPEQLSKLLFETYFSYLHKLIDNIYSDSLQELLSIIVKLDPPYFLNNPKEYYIDQRKQLVNRAISNIFGKPNGKDLYDMQYNTFINSAHFLTSLLFSSKVFINEEEIISPLLQPSTIEKILKGLADVNLADSFSALVKQLCEYFISKYATSHEPIILKLPFGEDYIVGTKVPDTELFILEVSKSLSGINDTLKIENKEICPQPIDFQFGKAVYSFGHFRVKLVEIVYWFLKLQNQLVNKAIKQTQILTTLLNLFTLNPWNSVLHLTLLRIFTFMIKTGSEVLITALFEDAKVFEYLIQAHQESSFEINSKCKGKVQKGYLSYLKVLATNIHESENSLIQSYCLKSLEWQKAKDLGFAYIMKRRSIFSKETNKKSTLPDIRAPKDRKENFHDLVEDAKLGSLPLQQSLGDCSNLTQEESKINHLSKRTIDPNQVNSKELNKIEEIISPTYRGDFKDTDINERDDCEIKYPHSVEVKYGFSSLSNINEEDVFEMIIERSTGKTGSPKLESLKIQAKDVEDEREELIY